MKTRIFITVSLCLAAALAAALASALLTACGGSPTKVYETSRYAPESTLTVEKDKLYTYDTFCFSLDAVKGASPAPKTAPRGQWIEIRLNIVSGSLSQETMDRFTEDENILLNGAPPKSCDLKAEMNVSDMKALNYFLNVYYDVPESFDVRQAVVTCRPNVLEGNRLN